MDQKEIKQLTKNLRVNNHQSSRPRSELDKSERLAMIPEHTVNSIEKIWDRMVAILGRSWTTQWGTINDEHFVTWCEVCKDLTQSQLMTGFKAFMESSDEFLNAKKFRQLCLKKSEHETNWAAYKTLPRSNRLEDKGKKERSQEARKKLIGSIKEKLK